jgi:hypothetical protein
MLGTLHHERHEAREHQDSEGENMPPRQRSRQSFIASCETAKARGPDETALDHPAPWQSHEAFLRVRPFDHFELHPMVGSVLPCSVTGIALIHRGDFHRGVRDVLLLLGQLRHLGAILFVCGGDLQGQQVAQNTDGHMPVALPVAFGPIGARAGATFGAGLQGPTFENDRRGMCPSAKRHGIRKSSPMASNTSALSQRWVCSYTAAHGGGSFGVTRHGARPYEPAQPMEDFTQRMCPLGASAVMSGQ